MTLTTYSTQFIIDSISQLFAQPEFDNMRLRLMGSDDRCIILGLFEVDDEGEETSDKPTLTWTIEVSQD